MVESISRATSAIAGRVLPGQEPPDARDHLIPIAQQEERDDRRQEKQRQGVEQIGAALEQALKLGDQPRGGRAA